MATIRLYEVFRAIMITGTVSGAAKLLRRSQPAVSRTLSELEKRAGVVLFERNGRKLRPTPEANRLLPEVEEILKKLNQLNRYTESLSEPNVSRITLATVPAYSMYFAAELIKNLRSQYPDLVLSLLVRDPSVIIDMVRNGEVDAGIGGVALKGELQERIIMQCHLVCAIPKEHSLAKKKIITAEDLNGQDFIAFDHEISPMHITRQIVEKAGGRPLTIIETQRTHSACALVAAGVGVTLVEPLTALSFSSSKVSIRPFQPEINHSINLLTKIDQPHSASLRSLEEISRKVVTAANKEITHRFSQST